MSAPEKPTAAPLEDPIEALARTLYVTLCGRIYSVGGDKPQPKAVAQLSFKLAESFIAANYEFNPNAIAAREARGTSPPSASITRNRPSSWICAWRMVAWRQGWHRKGCGDGDGRRAQGRAGDPAPKARSRPSRAASGTRRSAARSA